MRGKRWGWERKRYEEERREKVIGTDMGDG